MTTVTVTGYDEGDWRVPNVAVDPFDGGTGVTLEIVSPTNVVTSSTPSGSGGTWEGAAYELTSAGEWIERWIVTATGKSKARSILLVGADPTATLSGRVYATSADYANELVEAPPTGIRRKLLMASRMVDQMLLTACYTTDDDGYPTDTDVIAAMKLATVLQVEFAASIGDAKMVGGPRAAGFSLGKLSVQKSQPSGGGAGGVGPRGEWAPRAWETLQLAGLTGHEPTAPWARW